MIISDRRPLHELFDFDMAYVHLETNQITCCSRFTLIMYDSYSIKRFFSPLRYP